MTHPATQLLHPAFRNTKQAADEMALLHADLLSTFTYNPDEGCFRWKVRPSPRTSIGRIAGSATKQGNGTSIPWRGKSWSEAQLAVFYMTGKLPLGKVSRYDGVTTVSRFENLLYTLPDGRRFQGSKEITPHE